MAKKGLFDMDSGGEAAKLAPGGDHAMTGDEERHRIAPAGLPHRPSRPGPSHPGGDFPVGGYLTGGDLPKASPDLELKGSSLEVHRMIEGAQLAGEVSLESGSGCSQGAAIFPELNGAMMLVEVSERPVELLPLEKLAAADPFLRSCQE
jgi:hypothetical protein